MKSEYQNHIRESIVFLPSTVIHIPVGVVSPTSLTQESHPRAMQRVSPQVGVGALLRCHSLALTGRACHTPSNSWYSSGFHIFQSAIRSDSICICCLKNDSEQAFAFAVQCLGGVLGASRRKRDLIYENMVTDDPSPCTILKIIIQECLGDEK